MSSFDELLTFDVAALGEKIRSRQISPVEVTEAISAGSRKRIHS